MTQPQESRLEPKQPIDMTREIDIRNALRQRLIRENQRHVHSEALILDELGLCQNEVRIDMAVINGSLHGFEIKSDQDTLKRLPEQAKIYSQIFDTVTIVAPARHLEKAHDLVPKWWGLIEVKTGKANLVLPTIRCRSRNPEVDPYALAQLLWRQEALNILEEHGLAKGSRSKSVKILWQKLADSFSLTQLNELVRITLKNRQDWRADGLRI